MTQKKSGIGRLGPRAARMKWEKFTSAAVFEIVCEPTGRRFIGCSDRPNLRKAAYFYQLQHIRVFDFSNIFFGSLTAMADLEAHGLDSFYFEIVKSMPGSSTAEQTAALEAYKAKFAPQQLYNRRSGRSRSDASIFAAVDPEMRALEERRLAAAAALAKCEAEHAVFRKENTAARHRIATSDASSLAKTYAFRDQSLIARARRLERDRLRCLYNELCGESAALQKVMIKKWGKK